LALPTRLIASLPGNSRQLALLLGLLLLGLALASDLWISQAPQLSLPLLAAALISAGLCRWGVPRLRQLKLGQVIREDGPQAHLSKAGTPTMGGLLAVPVGVIVGALVAPTDSRLPAVAAITLAYMAIGAADDWRSLTKRHNTGLTPRGKLLLQALSAARDREHAAATRQQREVAGGVRSARRLAGAAAVGRDRQRQQLAAHLPRERSHRHEEAWSLPPRHPQGCDR